MLEITIDITNELPNADELRDFGIASMRVRTIGPGGGNPVVTIAFVDAADGAPNVAAARKFLEEWYGDDDVALYSNVSSDG